VLGETRGLAAALGGSPLADILPAREPLPPAARMVLEDLGVSPSILLEPGARAMMPFRLRVE
jgi:hypothetical protein